MRTAPLTTEISTLDEKGIYVRGKSLVDDIIGEISFTQMIYLHVMGRMPTDGERKILDAVLVTLVDHGLVASLGARMVYLGAPDAIQGAIATGILQLGSQFGGVMELVGGLLEEIIAASDPDAKAKEIVERYRSQKRPVPGFGHPDHRPEDPRTPKLLAVAESAGVEGRYIAALRTLAKAVDTALGKHITINATSGLAALLGEIGIPCKIMRGFAAISRAAGIVGHINEEIQRPAAFTVTRMIQDAVEFTGKMPPSKTAQA